MYDQSGNLYSPTWNPQVANLPFWAKLLSFDGSKFYSWVELTSEIGGFVDTDGGRFGTLTLNPAYEANGLGLKVPSIVLLKRGYFDSSTGMDWVYVVAGLSGSSSSGGGGGTSPLTVADTHYPTGILFNNVTLLELDTAAATLTGGLNSVPPGGSFVVFTPQPASATRTSSAPGYVTTTDQGFAGIKTFYAVGSPNVALFRIGSVIDILNQGALRISNATDITAATYGAHIFVTQGTDPAGNTGQTCMVLSVTPFVGAIVPTALRVWESGICEIRTDAVSGFGRFASTGVLGIGNVPVDITIPRLTPSGSNGSITVVGGIVIAFTDPT